ncbi:MULTISPECIES: hypothetical protein [Cyanophyceae]|uniref:hypothetical protein n=1 Tax=Cyanophyceae TaxID=3028117 RepID=UPI0016891DEE|nr:hypothetical protein [Trichocoleus sp. FACHB-69]MBD1931267.1 hypothetical protein [Trichocoleus sp. FACHB-69]
MTQFPNDDKRLVEFLRQNQGDVPTAAPGLESKIMQAVASSPRQSHKRRQMWIVPPAIAACLLAAVTGYLMLVPTTASVKTAELEAFMENNWDSVVDESPETSKSQDPEASWWLADNNN